MTGHALERVRLLRLTRHDNDHERIGLHRGTPLAGGGGAEFRSRHVDRVGRWIDAHCPRARGRLDGLDDVEFAGRRFFRNGERPVAGASEGFAG